MDRHNIELYKQYMLNEPLDSSEDDYDDPVLMIKSSIDATVLGYKETLLNILKTRKGDVLPAALNVFNRVQERTLKTRRIGSFKEVSKDMNINELIQKAEWVIQDPRSPVISGLI